jgi:hypothetical protein
MDNMDATTRSSPLPDNPTLEDVIAMETNATGRATPFDTNWTKLT